MQRLSTAAVPWLVGSAVALLALWLILLCRRTGLLAGFGGLRRQPKALS